MKQISYTEARATLAKVLDTATDDLEEVVVIRAGHDPAVVVSLREYEALKGTVHLLGTPANARHLQRGLEEYAVGNFAPGERLDVPDEDADDSTGAREAPIQRCGPGRLCVDRRQRSCCGAENQPTVG